MAAYRKKPVVIEAVTVTDALNDASNNWASLPGWLQAAYEKGDVLFLNDRVSIQSREGRVEGSLHHWIIKGIEGEIYCCDSDIFAATYEDADIDSQLRERCEAAGHPMQRCHCGAQGMAGTA